MSGANKITDIPVDIFSTLIQIRELQLYKNKLTMLPPEIGNLKALRRLSLSSNNLKGLPEEIGACTSLRELYINNNAKFSNIPGTAGHLR
jgi:Leucine-rich repeat (LRR) protein